MNGLTKSLMPKESKLVHDLDERRSRRCYRYYVTMSVAINDVNSDSNLQRDAEAAVGGVM